MKTLHTDVCILGAGTSGLNARREADKAGLAWVMVDPGPYGTTCARVGCMPSKLLIAAAESAHAARHATVFGVHATEVIIDGKAVMARVKSERDRFAGFVSRDIEQMPPDQMLRGRGRFVAADEVEVEGIARVRARAFVVATGSSPWIPHGLEAVRDRVLVNDDIFELDDLPDSVAVLGTGVIGLELGQALHRLGVRVRFFNPSQSIAGIADPVVREEATRLFGAELDLHLGTTVRDVRPDPEGVRLTFTNDEGEPEHDSFSDVLAAAGRRPNVQDMGLDHLGVSLDERGLPSFDRFTMQIGDLPVFIAGDVDGELSLLHEAADEGRIAGANAASYPSVSHGHRRTPLAIVFSDPQVASAGASFQDLPEHCTAVGEVSFGNQGRARVMAQNQGLVRLYADTRSTRLLGASMLGPRMEHMAHLMAWAITNGLTVNEILERPFYHPCLEEGLRTALRELAKTLKTAARCPPEDCAESAGA